MRSRWRGRSSPNVVLLDVKMPKLDGFDTLMALRGRPETQDLPVIMVTGNHGEHDIVRGFQLGADDYIVSLFNARELVVRVGSSRAQVRDQGDPRTEPAVT